MPLYRPLDPAKREIRLLRLTLDPPSYHSLVEAQLQAVSLDDTPFYYALSYCWGDTSDTRTISVDGQDIKVTRNLHDALLELRRREVRTIWIDALCINQNDDRERVQQVAIMAQIYAYANSVFAWLGLSDSQSSSIMQAIQQGAPLTFNQWSHLASRPYWRRGWILQEVAKAKHVDILWGADSICWEVMTHTPELLQSRQQSLLALVKFRARGNLAQVRGTPMSLVEALVQARYSLVSLPRDRIYSLLSMTTEASLIEPDYSQPLALVNISIANAILESGNASMLLLNNRCARKPAHYPSWLPDFESLVSDMPPWVVSTVLGRLSTSPCTDKVPVLTTLDTTTIWYSTVETTGHVQCSRTSDPSKRLSASPDSILLQIDWTRPMRHYLLKVVLKFQGSNTPWRQSVAEVVRYIGKAIELWDIMAMGNQLADHQRYLIQRTEEALSAPYDRLKLPEVPIAVTVWQERTSSHYAADMTDVQQRLESTDALEKIIAISTAWSANGFWFANDRDLDDVRYRNDQLSKAQLQAELANLHQWMWNHRQDLARACGHGVNFQLIADSWNPLLQHDSWREQLVKFIVPTLRPLLEGFRAMDRYNMQLAMTKFDYYEVIPAAAQPGDDIFTLAGCDLAMVLRSNGDDGDDGETWRLVGEVVDHNLFPALKEKEWTLWRANTLRNRWGQEPRKVLKII